MAEPSADRRIRVEHPRLLCSDAVWIGVLRDWIERAEGVGVGLDCSDSTSRTSGDALYRHSTLEINQGRTDGVNRTGGDRVQREL